MAPSLSKAYLRRLRNDIPIRTLIADVLDIPWQITEGRFRFLCPLCGEFNTATHPGTNLARPSAHPAMQSSAHPIPQSSRMLNHG